jgi:hypothetical protein
VCCSSWWMAEGISCNYTGAGFGNGGNLITWILVTLGVRASGKLILLFLNRQHKRTSSHFPISAACSSWSSLIGLFRFLYRWDQNCLLFLRLYYFGLFPMEVKQSVSVSLGMSICLFLSSCLSQIIFG